MFRQEVIPCPAAGCRAKLTQSDLQPNKNLENRVKAHAKREREKAAREEIEREEILDSDDED